jgi:hypothetical protein
VEDYTQIKHVAIELAGDAVKAWHYTIYGDAQADGAATAGGVPPEQDARIGKP